MLIFQNKFPKKGYLQSKIGKMKYKISAYKMIFLGVFFNQICPKSVFPVKKLRLFGPNLPKRGISSQNREHHH